MECYTRPSPVPNRWEPRFSTPERGAWYAAFELATAKVEVIFTRALSSRKLIGTRRAARLSGVSSRTTSRRCGERRRG